MNGGAPPPDYLAQIHQTLSGGPAPTGPIMIGAPPAGPPPAGPPPPAMPPPEMPGQNMSTMPPPGMSAAPPPPPPPPAPHAPAGTPFPLVQVRGGGVANIAAKETELRGPQLRGAQEVRNEAMAGAVQAVNERNQQTAAADFALALEQERKAQIRQEAADYSAAERTEEMAQRQQDFDQSVKALSQHSVDPGRFWANANAGQVIAALVSTVMAGYVSGKTGRPGNVGLDAINGMIDRDIKAQEFSYNALRDTTSAKQTAFSMAMQKYNNVDAARSAARAAALDATQAQIAKSSALWKGADAQSRAQMALAALEDEKMQQIAQGVAYTPAQRVAVGGVWVDRMGLSYNEAQAREVSKEMRGQEFEKDKIGMNVAGDVLKTGAAAEAKRSEKAGEESKFIAEKLQAAGVPQARHSLESAMALLNKSPGGVGEAFVRGALPGVAAQKVLGETENAREQAFALARADLIHALTGAGMSDTERQNYYDMMGSASTPEARIRTIKAGLAKLEAIEKNVKAGVTPAAQQEFDRRRQNAEGTPPAAPKGSKAGW